MCENLMSTKKMDTPFSGTFVVENSVSFCIFVSAPRSHSRIPQRSVKMLEILDVIFGILFAFTSLLECELE